MFQTYESAFENKSVLRAQALNEGLNGAMKIIDQMFSGYSDGILKDILLEQESDCIVLKSGVVIFQGRVYYLDKEIHIRIHPNYREECLKLRFLEAQYKDGLKKWTTDIVLDENEITRNNEMELCRFQYQPGARLRNTYGSFQDFADTYNIINILYAPYAAPGESTISPQITQAFSDNLMKREWKDPYDMAFCFECQRGGAVNRKSIIAYIRHKLAIDKEQMSNDEIYMYLSRILESNGVVEYPGMRKQRLIIV